MIPQELVEAIVDEIDDTLSLKACALVSPSFLSPSQRNLFRSFTLNTRRTSECCNRLTESPHIAPHISALTIHLNNLFIDGTPGLEELLDKLDNVRRCTIRGSSTHTWKAMITVTQPLLKFIERQSLLELHLLSIMELSRPTLAFFLSSAARLSFYYVTIDPENTDTVHPPPRTQNPKTIVLTLGTENLLDSLASPEFSPYVVGLRKLALTPFQDGKYNAVFTSATMLEQVRFYCHFRSINLYLPPHPTLRSVDIAIDPGTRGEYNRLARSFTTLLDSASTSLEEISVTLNVLYSTSLTPLDTQTLAALSTVLAGNRTDLPRIRWRIPVESGAQALSDFTAVVQSALSTLHAQGKVIVEQYSAAEERQGHGQGGCPSWNFS
ncbi:hypothetical protein C8R43DRAFT_1110291 [Mycena crocata]|nr:hypothetical protein C8R43DRAFT_1110291 [Mycena crocata]